MGTAINCPGCGSFYASLADFQDAGGQVQSVGLALMASCPNCGRRWAINGSWSKRPIGIEKVDLNK